MVNQVQSEFGRQAAHMATAPAFSDEQALRRIKAALGEAPIGRVLEVACGPGIVAEAIAPLATELVCIDATPQMLALAKSRLEKTAYTNVVFQEAFAEALPFAAGTFDAIVTRLSFHHFADLQAVFAEFHRVLRPQGRLIVADITTSANDEEARLHNALEQLRDPSHVRMFSQAELLNEFRSGRFEVKAMEGWVQQRSFAEWARIVSSPGRTAPLFEVMRTLCRSGLRAGIGLQEVGQDLAFTHSWLLLTAVPEAAAKP